MNKSSEGRKSLGLENHIQLINALSHRAKALAVIAYTKKEAPSECILKDLVGIVTREPLVFVAPIGNLWAVVGGGSKRLTKEFSL